MFEILTKHLLMMLLVLKNWAQEGTKIFIEKMGEAFAMQKLLRFFQQQNIGIFQILTFEILMELLLTMSLVLKKLGPRRHKNFC